MKSHPVKGVAILESLTALNPILPIVRSHHERWDGRGYPDGLAGERIPLIARVVAVADAFDAMTSDRCYRSGMPSCPAFEILRNNAGTQFDKASVQAFLAIRSRIEECMAKSQANSGIPPGSFR
jgi:HD-GYP domain-containing protein (c-di-GMP phosphodiesterase class II)